MYRMNFIPHISPQKYPLSPYLDVICELVLKEWERTPKVTGFDPFGIQIPL
jgi:hypothetical protein